MSTSTPSWRSSWTGSALCDDRLPRPEARGQGVEEVIEGALEVERRVEQELDLQSVHRGEEPLGLARDLVLGHRPEGALFDGLPEDAAHRLEGAVVAIGHERVGGMLRRGRLRRHGDVQVEESAVADVVGHEAAEAL